MSSRERMERANGELQGIRACVFDAYGTLLDFRTAALRCRDSLGDDFDALNTLWRDKQLQYTWLRSLQERFVDFRQITADALDFALETLGISDPSLRERLMDLYTELEVFPEVTAVLQRLKAAGFRTAVLSNGTQAMLETALKRNDIADLVDDVISVDAVGVYKPSPRVYALAPERLGLEAGEIAFQSANAWDAFAASAFGLRVVWCNRYGQPAERLPGRPDIEIASLDELPELVGARRVPR